ncbi:MAG: PEGA domain-containing protein [Myxococcaceae bacterium]|nr:PEGA domain-containing protein [Myxococcaceae bacterium]
MSASTGGFTERLAFALRVNDAKTGEVLPSVRVEFLQPAIAPRPHRTADLFWVFVGLMPGRYRIRVTAPGHRTLERTITVRRTPTLARSVLELNLPPSA